MVNRIMTIPNTLICSSHTISGVLPGAAKPARHRFSDRVSAAAHAGYTGMCLHLRDYRAQRVAGFGDTEMAALLRDHGMQNISLEFLANWFLEHDTGAQEDEATAYEAARAFGAHSVNVGGDFQQTGIPPEQMRIRFAALCKRAERHNLNVALEIVPFSNVATLETALFITDGIANAGLVVDCWHMFRAGIALCDLARLPGERILSIQVSDAHPEIRGTLAQDTLRRLPCDEGVFDLDGFVAALDAAGASVPLSVEIISPNFAALDLDDACTMSIRGAQALLARRQVLTG
ncbi:sugar phosphate isomerase/epimerase family protein [Primorskyibacter marinus]|uniref:sugar phosphate isomerase/epimerase family protein n=1 Tax=Primorskyibacter marinus TaxID=1977320 RepID=UPI000E30B3F2|nr:sugar phosphate isomerase/epimerase family protein [Primorskyibacter marinus]